MIGREEMASVCARRGLDWILEKFLHLKAYQVLEQAAQGSGGVPIPGGI